MTSTDALQPPPQSLSARKRAKLEKSRAGPGPDGGGFMGAAVGMAHSFMASTVQPYLDVARPFMLATLTLSVGWILSHAGSQYDISEWTFVGQAILAAVVLASHALGLVCWGAMGYWRREQVVTAAKPAFRLFLEHSFSFLLVGLLLPRLSALTLICAGAAWFQAAWLLSVAVTTRDERGAASDQKTRRLFYDYDAAVWVLAVMAAASVASQWFVPEPTKLAWLLGLGQVGHLFAAGAVEVCATNSGPAAVLGRLAPTRHAAAAFAGLHVATVLFFVGSSWRVVVKSQAFLGVPACSALFLAEQLLIFLCEGLQSKPATAAPQATTEPWYSNVSVTNVVLTFLVVCLTPFAHTQSNLFLLHTLSVLYTASSTLGPFIARGTSL